MTEERWKNFGSYQVSNLGRLKRPSGEITCGWERNGYKAININQKKHYVHRLVAELFCEGWFEGALVDHIDRDKENNSYLNLRWVSLSDNANNSKGRVYYKGISEDEVLEMVRLKEVCNFTNTKIASILGTDRRNVSRILNGRSRSDLTGIEKV
jgi:hypothetical protein|tara:strand:- start:43 stop:504 length:462 start_codon:yes stop_codon:yes gene_type:complete